MTGRSAPVIVIGTGRCGTSTAARLLHTRLGVCMYKEEYIPADANNPLGYFEDAVVGRLAPRVARGRLTPEEWAHQVREHYRGEASWGFKLVGRRLVPSAALRALAPRLVVLCTRARLQVVTSAARYYKKPLSIEYWKVEWERRTAAIAAALHGLRPLILDFTVRRTDDEVVEALGAALRPASEASGPTKSGH